MQGVPAYKIPVAKANTDAMEDEQGQVLEIGGIAYVFYPKHKILANMQGISQKFETWDEVHEALGGG